MHVWSIGVVMVERVSVTTKPEGTPALVPQNTMAIHVLLVRRFKMWYRYSHRVITATFFVPAKRPRSLLCEKPVDAFTPLIRQTSAFRNPNQYNTFIMLRRSRFLCVIVDLKSRAHNPIFYKKTALIKSARWLVKKKNRGALLNN